jgi:hypothetical protein
MAYQDEVEVISALCKNKDIHTMFDGGADLLIKDCADIWGFIKDYYSQTKQIPDIDLVATRFRDFDVVDAGHDAPDSKSRDRRSRKVVMMR